MQELTAFEFAEMLPMALGLVIDGSGSMDKSMPLVKQAATEFVSNLIGEKDKGFVIEFRERPSLLAAMTSNRADLIRAIGETRAGARRPSTTRSSSASTSSARSPERRRSSS